MIASLPCGREPQITWCYAHGRQIEGRAIADREVSARAAWALSKNLRVFKYKWKRWVEHIAEIWNVKKKTWVNLILNLKGRAVLTRTRRKWGNNFTVFL